MTEPDARAMLAQIMEKIDQGQLPDVDNLTREQKDVLLRVAHLFSETWTIEAAAKVLPLLKTEDDVAAFRFSLRFAKGVLIAYQVIRFCLTPMGAIFMLILASLITGFSPLEVLTWYKSAKP